MRFIYILTIAAMLAGCSSKNSGFVLSKSGIPQIASSKVQIGVQKVEVPDYLNSDKILIKEGLEVKELNAQFAQTPAKLFTAQAISVLKKSLNNPNVFLYPWDVDKKRGYIIKIDIDDFLYQNGKVVLSGSYYIKSADGIAVKSSNFNLSKTAGKDSYEIIEKLSELYNNLLLEIAKNING